MRNRTLGLFLLLGLFSFLSISSRASASDPDQGSASADRVVNVDTAATANKGGLDGSLDVRFLSGREDLTFGSIRLRYGVTANIEAGVRAVTGSTRSIVSNNGNAIRFGGRDAEIYAKYGFSGFRDAHFALLAGLSFPATPAQHNTTATLSGVGEFRLFDRVTGYVNPRAVFLNSNSLFGVGIGTSIRVTNNIHIVGDYTPIVSGENTISNLIGVRSRADIWGVAVRLTAAGSGHHYDLDLGYSNATGSTTGTSLTPGIGGSSGFYFALRARP